MKVLFVIPHFYKPLGTNTRYASYSSAMRDARRQGLDRCIFNLHRLFGSEHYGAKHHRMQMQKLPNAFSFDFDIKVCTSGDFHLIDELSCPTHYFEHIASSAEPLLLGYFCHQVMKSLTGRYDYYCYLEDDILIHDPFFFQKLERFNAHAPWQHLLQPQRYDCSLVDGQVGFPFLTKVYPDYEMAETSPHVPTHHVRFLGLTITLAQTNHPHAGCFFLNREQFEWVQRSTDFANTDNVERTAALDTAATLAIAKSFTVFKPAGGFASFFEVEHGVINMLRQVSLDEHHQVKWHWDPSDFSQP